uniref:CCHC-type domain-containing protein n=1 Tax=Populus alba TaxID=43335 RepID=A0A4U5PNK7_POPAL|nr:hypothetical protein D5086_0000199780 [Populus alba]
MEEAHNLALKAELMERIGGISGFCRNNPESSFNTKDKGGNSRQGPAPGVCYHCRKPRHLSNTCPDHRKLVNWIEGEEGDPEAAGDDAGEDDCYEGVEFAEEDGK